MFIYAPFPQKNLPWNENSHLMTILFNLIFSTNMTILLVVLLVFSERCNSGFY
jgi:hypothetical protein